jgi:glutamate-ammonia-ligase adenylyltransferase
MLEARLRRAVEGSPLEEKFPTFAEPFLELRSKDPGAQQLEGPALVGLARVLASSADAARFLSRRPNLLQRLVQAHPDSLHDRSRELLAEADTRGENDLEEALDDLRLLRRDETMFAACLDLGGLVQFEGVSAFLSCLAESIVGRALRLARRDLEVLPGDGLAVIGMGKIAGREMTYHSDLDLIFLIRDDAPQSAEHASRIAQRLISYLMTMTAAGVAYAVDSRLRPSGRQGMLVSSFDAYERYQREEAATWEHLALTRARAIAGSVGAAGPLLARVREAVLGEGRKAWDEVDEMRRRVQAERTRPGKRLSIKSGPGGIMEVDFLANGTILERGASAHPGPLPSIPAMLSAAGRGPRLNALQSAYRFLRRVQARARWAADRAVEDIPSDPASLAVLADLFEPGLEPSAFLERVEETCARNRDAYAKVIEAGTIDVLCDGNPVRNPG